LLSIRSRARAAAAQRDREHAREAAVLRAMMRDGVAVKWRR